MKSLKHAKTNWHQIFFYVNYYFSHRISNVTSISDTFSLTNNRLCIQITDWTFRNLCVFDSVSFSYLWSLLTLSYIIFEPYISHNLSKLSAQIYISWVINRFVSTHFTTFQKIYLFGTVHFYNTVSWQRQSAVNTLVYNPMRSAQFR